MKSIRIPYYYVFIAIVIAVAAFISVEIYPFQSTANLLVFIVTIMSLVISFIAFIIAMKTYISIDSVNVISQMEGNVLENENYVASLTSLLKEYNMEDSKQVGAKIFRSLTTRFSKESKTAIEFASNLQYFIDLIVFFPSLFQSSDENKEENVKNMEKILQLIDKRKEALLSISTGNMILIEETVKLIKYVISYQQLIHSKEYNVTSSLLEVRGTMLKNSVTQTVYYNYLGLFYNKKAMYVLRKRLGYENEDFFEIDILKDIHQRIHTLEGEEIELYTMYLIESKKAFQKALESCKEDVMWEGFIKYNDARSTFFLQLIQMDYKGTDWLPLMNEAIIARSRLNILIGDILDQDRKSHLQESFIYQEYLARLVKINLQLAQGEDITDTTQRVKHEAPLYKGLENERHIKTVYTKNFDKIRNYQILIEGYLNRIR
ncbi:hypothetical protein [Robertmurraya sp. FSL R5-0851]|uniref:hypothetical protein n=1 Tax=Robertmurraya sp. FSL R5-0851 TaxID=2921584 RepID=UPI0030FC9E01